MKVLSLFDGISCGMVALERAGIQVDAYYASEIDKNAIAISQKNYPNIIRLGDVTKWREWDIPWEEIDLLIGGSPCQGFSFAGKQLNFNDPRSKLFFEFVDILNHIRTNNSNIKFLLENVCMKKEYQNIISKHLGVEPIMINSALVSGQQRKRLYWTNIPNVCQPVDKGIFLKDILQDESVIPCALRTRKDYTGSYKKLEIKKDRKANAITGCRTDSMYCKPIRIGYFDKGGQGNRIYSVEGKSVCLSANSGGIGAKTGLYRIDLPDGDYVVRKLSPVECERLQTLPDNYTAAVSDTHRIKALGNGWTVDVIVHIFKGLKEI